MIRSRCLALVLTFLLSTMASAAAPTSTWRDWAKKSEGRFAYSISMAGKKVGWIIEETKLGIHAGKPVVMKISEERMETLYDGAKNVKSEHSVTCYELSGDGTLVYHTSKKIEDGKTTRRIADRIWWNEKSLRITTEIGNRKVTRYTSLPRDTLDHNRDLERWLESPRQAGDRFLAFGLNWDTNNINSKQHYLFRERKKIVSQGRPIDVLRVQITIEGGKMDAHVLPDGRIVRAEMGRFMHLELVREEEAKKLPDKRVELSDLTSVPVEVDLGEASDVTMLRLEMTGLDDFVVPASHRQIVTRGKNSTSVELRKDFRIEKGAELSRADRGRFLKTSPRFQIEQEAVRSLAKQIVGAEKDTLAKARLINRWVYRKLKKTYAENADTALEILDNMAGDCTEHSLLCVALCRAAGVPAREAGGLAYAGGKKHSFSWHAWAEIHDGHQWVSIDPTWDQIYVDATHIKMSEGDRDLAWTNVLGTLKMKVLDFKRGK